MTCLKPNKVYFSEKELAARWGASIKMLQSHRQAGKGIPWVKIGRLVRYDLQDIEAYEKNVRNVSEMKEGGYV